jgi:predicted component of type VI protein secretion system
MDQLRADKTSVERKLQDAEMQLKAIDDSNRQGSLSHTRKSLMAGSDHDEDEDSNAEERNRNSFHNNDDADRLSDTDSDVVEMEKTLKELRQTQMEYMSLLPISNIDDRQNQHFKTTGTVNLTKLSVADVAPTIRNIRTINRSTPRMYDSFETTPNQLLTDTGRWSNSMLSTLGNTNSLLMYQTLNRYQPTTNHYSSQPTLVTREAVLKAARTVFAPGVIDQLNSHRKSSTH